MATAPVGVLAIVLSPWVGRNVGRIDPRKLATFSFIGFAIVLWHAQPLRRAGALRGGPDADRAAGRGDGRSSSSRCRASSSAG
jgi:hypothetical protein